MNAPTDLDAPIDLDALRAHIGAVSDLADWKVLPALDQHARHFIRLCPFLVLASADGQGQVDASPRGDPPGFVQVLDDQTLLIPDRPGNNRVDSFRNILASPAVGLVLFVPGIDETLRISGTARLSFDEDALAAAEVQGRVPRTGLVIDITAVMFHCAKALRRSRLWDPAAQIERSEFPSLGRIIADQIAGFTADVADARIEKAYRERMY